MTRPTRTALVAPAWRRWMFAGAASLLLVVSHVAWAQTVRVTRGDGAMVLPNGPNVRLGSQSADGTNLVLVERDRICCPGPKANPRPRCVTERQVPLGASRMDIIERYGPPGTGSTQELLRYPGIEFTMRRGQIITICAVR
jgi:hypothetical protein